MQNRTGWPFDPVTTAIVVPAGLIGGLFLAHWLGGLVLSPWRKS